MFGECSGELSGRPRRANSHNLQFVRLHGCSPRINLGVCVGMWACALCQRVETSSGPDRRPCEVQCAGRPFGDLTLRTKLEVRRGLQHTRRIIASNSIELQFRVAGEWEGGRQASPHRHARSLPSGCSQTFPDPQFCETQYSLLLNPT